MKIRKFLLATLAICSLSFGFASCSSDNDDDDKSSNGIVDDQTWSSLVKANSWLSNYPAYPEKFGTSSSLDESMVMIGDYNATEELLEKYKAALTNDGFSQNSFTSIGILSKEIGDEAFNVTLMFQEVSGIKMLSISFTKTPLID